MKMVVYVILLIAIAVVIALVLLWMKSPGVSKPIPESDTSISTIETVELGGLDQSVIIRGVDANKPVMLFLHGGPGSPEVAFVRYFNPDIEKDYVMVYWEQRGAGKSYSASIDPSTMNVEQLISDTRELSEYLIRRFNRDKIFVMGHSWGSFLGILTAYHYPELFHAYIGIGQVCDQFKGEQLSYDWTLNQAMERNDRKAITMLQKLNFPDTTAAIDEWIDYVMVERRYVNRYGGGTTRGITTMWPLVKIVMNSEFYTLSEKMNFMKASMFSLKTMWLEVVNTNLFAAIDSMQVPVYIFHGQSDYTTPYPLAREFYDQLRAPQKAFFSFEHSAHSPILEEPEKFNSLLNEILAK
jgi:pimeloyl-ACP methyl ester carboxylesterase